MHFPIATLWTPPRMGITTTLLLRGKWSSWNLTHKHHFFFFGNPVWHVELAPLGIEPMPPAVEAWYLNHWATGEVQGTHF